MRNLLPWTLALILAGSQVHDVSAQAPGAQTPTGARPTAAPSDQVMLAPGDSIRVVVWRKPEMSGDFIVAPDGTITHPLYQAVRVGGIPFATAEVNIRNFLARFEQDPQFVAEPLIRVSVSGEVVRPTVYALRPETSIAEAVAQAGGPRTTGNRNHVRVLRKDETGRLREFQIDLLDPQGATARVHSGDQIIIDPRHSFFKDIFLPGLQVIGSLASIYLVTRRAGRF